jgi:hypothetical protein
LKLTIWMTLSKISNHVLESILHQQRIEEGVNNGSHMLKLDKFSLLMLLGQFNFGCNLKLMGINFALDRKYVMNKKDRLKHKKERECNVSMDYQ